MTIGLLRSSNLSDLDNVAQARTNLGLQQKTLGILADLKTAGLETYQFTALLNVTGPLQAQINTLAADLATAASSLTAFIDLDATLANLTAETLIATYEDSTSTGIGSSTDTFWDADSAGGIETASGITDVDVQGSLTCDSLGWGATPITIPVGETYGYQLAIGGHVIPLAIAPAPTINVIATDDVVNSSEAQAGFSITGTGIVGYTITLTFSNSQVLTGGNTDTVDANGDWSIAVVAADVAAFGEVSGTVTAVQADSDGNDSLPVTRSFTIDTVAPAAPTIDVIATNDSIDASEASTGFSITGTGVVGATITLTFTSSHTLAGGNTVVVDANGDWSIAVASADVTAFGQGSETVTAVQSDSAGNDSAPATRTFTVE